MDTLFRSVQQVKLSHLGDFHQFDFAALEAQREMPTPDDPLPDADLF